MRRERSSTWGRASYDRARLGGRPRIDRATQAFCALSRSRPPVAIVPYGDRERVPGCLRGIPLPFIRRDAGWARRGRSARHGGGCSQATSAGTVVRYVARLRNQRRGRERLASSLWDVTLNNGTRTTRIRELRRGRARSVSFSRRVPRTTRSRFCVHVVATAAGTRAADARVCVAVRPARASPVTG